MIKKRKNLFYHSFKIGFRYFPEADFDFTLPT